MAKCVIIFLSPYIDVCVTVRCAELNLGHDIICMVNGSISGTACLVYYIVIRSLNVTSLGVPSAPLNVVSHVSCGIAEYSVRVQWQTPSDDGGVGISNYTLTLTSDVLMIMKTTINTAENIHDLNYNTNYSVAVAARNCVGSSTFTSLDMMQGEDVLLYCVTESITIIFSNLPSPPSLQLAAVVHLLQSMAVLRST